MSSDKRRKVKRQARQCLAAFEKAERLNQDMLSKIGPINSKTFNLLYQNTMALHACSIRLKKAWAATGFAWPCSKP